MSDILIKNGYKFYINKRILVDFNDEEYETIKSISDNLMNNPDFKETLECFLKSLSSMYDDYNITMSKFFLKCILRKANKVKETI